MIIRSNFVGDDPDRVPVQSGGLALIVSPHEVDHEAVVGFDTWMDRVEPR